MLVILIVISIFYAAVIMFLITTWYKDVKHKEDTDKRILVLEKRIQDYYKDFSKTINSFKDDLTNTSIEQSDLERRLQKIERKNKSEKRVQHND